MNYDCIFWDWNGTLLDDVDCSVRTINISLKKRELPLLDKKKYLEIFRFPVIEYYKDMGFDFTKEDFTVVADEYTENYLAESKTARLRKEAKEVLTVFYGKKIPQYVLSASERKILTDALAYYGIERFFKDISAGDDYLADGKAQRGKMFADRVAPGKRILLVGDTEHDIETAEKIGADCVICKGGHCSEKVALSYGVPVIDDLYALYPLVFGTPTKKYGHTQKNADAYELRSFDLSEAEPNDFKTQYKAFYDDLKNTNKTEDW